MHPPITLLCALALLAGRAPAQETHLVPQQHATIQEAIEAAANGDTILVSSGTYAEAVVAKGFTGLVLKAKGKVVIDPPDGFAALTLDGCTDCTVQKVRVTGATDGIVLQGCTGGQILKCRVDGGSDNGITLEGCTGVLVEKCTLKETGDVGIGVGTLSGTASDNCTVLKCRVFEAGADGIELNGDDNTIEKNLVVGGEDDGIRTVSLSSPTGNTFTSNRVIKPHNHGFRITGVDNELFANRVVKPGSNGIQLSDGSGHVVDSCKVVKAEEDGLFGLESATGVTVTDCTFRKPGINGMDIDGDDAVVTGNITTGAGDNGYAVIGDDGTWTDNLAKGSGSDGFEVSGAGNTLTFNTAKGSKAGFDLNDLSGGANTIDDSNDFGTESP